MNRKQAQTIRKGKVQTYNSGSREKERKSNRKQKLSCFSDTLHILNIIQNLVDILQTYVYTICPRSNRERTRESSKNKITIKYNSPQA